MVFRYCTALLALAAAFPAHAQTYPDIVETSEETQALIAAEEAYLPQGDWRLRSSQHGCSVRRDFTLGDERVTLSMRRLQPGMPIQYALFGTEFSAGEPVEAGFVPGSGLARYTRLSRASIGERDGFVYAGFPFPSPQGESRPDERALSPMAEFYVIQGEEADPIILRTGPMRGPLNNLAECATDNLVELGVDVGALGSMLRRSSLQNVQEVSAHLGASYPRAARRDGQQGPVLIRVIVGPDGSVMHCHVASYLTARALREAACEVMRDHGEFEPALDFSDEPAADVYVERIIFSLQSMSWPNSDGTNPDQ